MPPEWSEHEETDQPEAFEDRVVAVFTNVAPNFASRIEHRHILGPHETEHENGLIAGQYHAQGPATQPDVQLAPPSPILRLPEPGPQIRSMGEVLTPVVASVGSPSQRGA